MMTGFAAERQRAHNLEVLIHEVISKPFTMTEIREAVDAVLAAEDAVTSDPVSVARWRQADGSRSCYGAGSLPAALMLMPTATHSFSSVRAQLIGTELDWMRTSAK